MLGGQERSKVILFTVTTEEMKQDTKHFGVFLSIILLLNISLNFPQPLYSYTAMYFPELYGHCPCKLCYTCLIPVKSPTEIKCMKVVTGVNVGKTEARLI